MTAAGQPPSARRDELLDLAYQYVLRHGLADMSLRPLAEAVGSSPRVLLFLFGSKEGLVRALLSRARAEELGLLQVAGGQPGADLVEFAGRVWDWLVAPEHRALLTLWVEGYGRSLIEPDGPWGDFARQTVADWLDVLGSRQPPARRRSRAGAAERTLVLAVLRGGFLDLLATGDVDRVSAAVGAGLEALRRGQRGAGRRKAGRQGGAD